MLIAHSALHALAGGGAAALSKDLPLIGGVVVVSLVLVIAFAVATGHIAGGIVSQIGKGDAGADDVELEAVVGGIAVGQARPPRWLYAAYVLIPVWALFYVINNSAVHSETVPTPKPAGASTPAASQAPAGPGGPVKISARSISFNTSAIALAAGKPAEIDFDNKDTGVPHNVAIYTDESLAKTIFKGDIVTGPKVTKYRFTAPAAGTYFFHCDVHPPMKGTVTVS